MIIRPKGDSILNEEDIILKLSCMQFVVGCWDAKYAATDTI